MRQAKLGTSCKVKIVFLGLGLLSIGNSLPELATALFNIYAMTDTPNILIRLLSSIVGAIIQLVIRGRYFYWITRLG